MKAKTLLFISLLLCFLLWGGCVFEPLKMYSGPDQPKNKLALIRQIDFLESRPIFLLNPTLSGRPEVRVDDLGMVLLPGTYRFKCYLYHYRYQESARIVDMTVRPGEATFPVAQPVLRKVREEKPYQQTDEVSFNVKPGFRYGLWCSEEGKIEMKVLGSYL
ncbi:MAG: hypothetical protein GY846_18735 [Deltaproteobacteria bacterium]|nr:hypothetical protein [Deltaproteobacteria bacterium]